MQDITFESFYPQGNSIALLHRQLLQGCLSHAIMLQGMSGTGKKTLARLLARGLLCREENPPCGICLDCLLTKKEEHPNLTMIRAGEPIAPGVRKDRPTIPVDDIRELIHICSEHTLGNGNRVTVIPDADCMTAQAQNALLKTLEEPPEGNYFILTTEHPENILTTVKSRCEQIFLHPWSEEDILKILLERGIPSRHAAEAARIAEGSPGQAIRFAEDEEYWKQRKEMSRQFLGITAHSDIYRVSAAWKDRKGDAETLFFFLEEQFQALLKYRLGINESLVSDEIPAPWRRVGDKAGIDAFSRLMDLVITARKQKEANVNFQAVIEQLLFGMIGECNRWQK